MAGLYWMAVTLSVLLYAGSSFAVVDQNQLSKIVNEILERYRPSYKVGASTRYPMFGLAASIPYDEKSNKYDFSQVSTTDSAVTVKSRILKCEKYSGTRVVAATVLRWPNVLDQCPNEPVQWGNVLRNCNNNKPFKWSGLEEKLKLIDNKPGSKWTTNEKQCRGAVWEGRADHAEYRTLEVFDTLVNQKTNKNDLLLFYVRASPCDQKCANDQHKWNILENIKKIKKWDNYALVFSDVFKPRDGEPIPEDKLSGALKSLGKSIDLKNIFRCVKDKCTCCSSGDQVTRKCFSDN